ncbi:hypothetical protein [Actibacterium sp. 188UL27-1]|uniref:hypothetical protein n=1 Tax=Actibacterium sp. 188UL27-1 TaxID=2786961 RepID=UPI00195BD46F|nr:hypothetical protein [Actibacterium sp. 188UL27-1]MBM7067250.1 hypothetical protein [Actibacterium sp. 188UL27-1]
MDEPGQAQTDRPTITVSSREKAMFDQARQTQNPADAVRFLNAYPESQLARPLLISLPPNALRSIPRDVVNDLEPDTVRRLPSNVQAQLGLLRRSEQSTGLRGGDDGYSG